MDKVEQRIDQIADDLSGAMDASVREAVAELRQIAAALREQPEARGVVDGLPWELRQRTKHAGVVTGELLNKAADALDALTAAQQPGQEGGGEVCPRCKGAGEYEGFARHASGDPQDEYAATVQCERCEGTGEVATPPSAPVGVEAIRQARAIIDHVIHGEPGYELSAAHGLLTAALTQQPAQAAPGDGRHRYEQSGEHGGCSVCGYPSHERLLHTPPGDDAAGGA